MAISSPTVTGERQSRKLGAEGGVLALHEDAGLQPLDRRRLAHQRDGEEHQHINAEAPQHAMHERAGLHPEQRLRAQHGEIERAPLEQGGGEQPGIDEIGQHAERAPLMAGRPDALRDLLGTLELFVCLRAMAVNKLLETGSVQKGDQRRVLVVNRSAAAIACGDRAVGQFSLGGFGASGGIAISSATRTPSISQIQRMASKATVMMAT